MASSESIAWLCGAAICLVSLSFLFWRLASWPHCSTCRLPLVEVASAALSRSPPVVETVYRCPRCAAVVQERVVGAWD